MADSTCVIASGVGFRSSFASGGISLLSQSGGVAGLLVERSQDAGAGLSVAVCTGNESDLKVGELLLWLAEHDPTRVVGIFLEGIREPDMVARGLDALRAAGKPVVVLKAGATAAAARASAAHTGALATEDDVVDAFLSRHGAVRVHGFDDLIDHAVALERLGPTTGLGIGILSTSGGAGVVATEAAERAGLELPELRPGTRERLAAVMPDFAALGNPADMSGMFSEKPEIFQESLRAFTEADEFGTAVMVLTVHRPEDSERLADLVLGARRRNLAVLWTAGEMSLPCAPPPQRGRPGRVRGRGSLHARARRPRARRRARRASRCLHRRPWSRSATTPRPRPRRSPSWRARAYRRRRRRCAAPPPTPARQPRP